MTIAIISLNNYHVNNEINYSNYFRIFYFIIMTLIIK